VTDLHDDVPAAARIPADISRPDRILGPLTARQTAILAVCGLMLYGGYWMMRPFVAPLTYAVMVVPVAGVVTAITLGTRDGISLDRFLLAALAHARTRKRRVHAPEGVPPLPDVVGPAPGFMEGRSGAQLALDGTNTTNWTSVLLIT
jgi:PrgI family protein